MVPQIGKLLRADEQLIHQTTETFATVSESDLNWTEKVWASIARRDGAMQVDFGIGRYHNRNVMDGFAGVSRGDTQWTARASRELWSDPDRVGVGPIDYEIVEPLKTLRFRLDRNRSAEICFDLRFEGWMEPHFEDRHLQREVRGNRVVSDVVRYHQPGTVSGWVEVEGERHTVAPDEWFAFRDHSWGVRLDVGQRPTDLRPIRELAEAAGDTGFLMLWSPMVLRRPDGSWYEYHFYLQAFGENVFYFSGYLNHANGLQQRIARVRPALRYDDVTRQPLGGTLHFDMLAGETHSVEVEVLPGAGFRLGTGLYMGYDGQKHGMWRGRAHEDGERISPVSDPRNLRRMHQLRDSILRVREGDAVGHGILESVAVGQWPQFGLTAESSFL